MAAGRCLAGTGAGETAGDLARVASQENPAGGLGLVLCRRRRAGAATAYKFKANRENPHQHPIGHALGWAVCVDLMFCRRPFKTPAILSTDGRHPNQVRRHHGHWNSTVESLDREPRSMTPATRLVFTATAWAAFHVRPLLFVPSVPGIPRAAWKAVTGAPRWLNELRVDHQNLRLDAEALISLTTVEDEESFVTRLGR